MMERNLEERTLGSLPCLIAEATEGTDEPAPPTVILLHGRGASPDDLAPLAEALPARFRAVFPRAPDPFPDDHPFGWAWYGMAHEYQAGAIRRSAGLIAGLLDELTGGAPTAAARTVLGGFSQGGVMSLAVGLSRRPHLAGILCMSGYLFDADEAFAGGHAGAPICVVHGTEDDVVPVRRAHEARRVLHERNVPLDYEEFFMGHEITPASWSYVLTFLQRVLSA